MTRANLAVSALLLCTLTCGCKISSEHESSAPPRPAQPVIPGGIDVIENTNLAHSDNAAAVLRSCGRPASDHVLAIYNKLNQGPVRRIVYKQKKLVTIEFIPTHPIERSQAKGHLTAKLPAGSVWRFDVAHAPSELDAITAARLQLLLPCAAKPLRSEF